MMYMQNSVVLSKSKQLFLITHHLLPSKELIAAFMVTQKFSFDLNQADSWSKAKNDLLKAKVPILHNESFLIMPEDN